MVDYRLDQSGQEVQDILNGAAMQVDLTAENERATEAEQTLQGNINDEETRAKGVEGTLQDNIDAEEARAKAAEKQNADDIDALEAVVPTGASSENKLATESFVNDSVATATATFRGTYNLVSDLHLTLEATHTNIANALATAVTTANNNDFVFVQIPTSEETPTVIGSIERYKYNGFSWSYEYTLNNSGFTQAQWDAVNSGITGGDVAKLRALPTNTELTTLLNGLQGDIDAEEGRAKAAELNLQGAIDAEEVRAKAAEKANADDIDALEAVIPSTASSENKVATASDVSSLSAAIEAILLLIPSAASSVNQLADKAFVNSSIATNTGIFRGTYNLVSDLHLTLAATHAQIGNALALAILEANNNDYAFVQIPTVATAPNEIAQTDRYKWNGSTWEYEYTLNNSGFTSAQWTAINSGITSALVSKLSALPTNSELTSEIGTLVSAINAINQKIPSSASLANKLVDTAALESYIIQVLGVLTVSYNITSTDGHFSFHIEQVNGKITAVEFTTSDVASQTALDALTLRVNTAEGTITTLGNRMTAAEENITSLGGRMTTAEGNITNLTGRVSTNEEDIAQLQAAYEALTQSEIIIGALPASGVANKIYRVPGTNSYSDYMWNGTQFVLMATYNNAIDDEPTPSSNNLVKSGGVLNSIIQNGPAFDLSAYNAVGGVLATYADLSAALTALNALDSVYKQPGMSFKFVQTDDNKYVQYRCMAQNFTTDVTQWQGVDVLPTAGSKNLVESDGIVNYVCELEDKIFDEREIKYHRNIEVRTGDFNNQNTILRNIYIPSGSVFKLKLSSDSGLFTQGTCYAYYGNTNYDAINGVQINTEKIVTALHDYTIITMYIPNGMLTSGTLNVEVSYIKNNEDTLESRVKELEDSSELLVKEEELSLFDKVHINESKNRFNKEAVIQGKKINPVYGTISDDTNVCLYYMPVNPGDIIYFWRINNNNVISFYADGLAAFNESGNFVKASSISTYVYTYTVPAGINKIACNFAKYFVLGYDIIIVKNDSNIPSKTDDILFWEAGDKYFESKESLQKVDYNLLLPLALKSSIEEKIMSVAHGGLSTYYPFDTELSIIGAKKAGFTAVEFDVQITSDGIYVLYHDTNMVRVGGTSSQNIGNMTFSELQSFDYGSWKDSKFSGTPLCTFDNAVMICKMLCLKIFIDCKTLSTAEHYRQANNIVEKWGMDNEVYWLTGNFNQVWSVIPNAKIVWPTASKLVGSSWQGADGWFTNFPSNFPDKSVEKDGIYVFKDDVYFGVVNDFSLMNDASYGIDGLQLESETARKYNIKYGLYFLDNVETIYNLCSSIPYMQYMESNTIAIQNALNNHYGISMADYLLSPNLLNE